ncbi:OLC1v1023662C1 [Oldenlandia corymbosa var. corymbosa]|uniref:OLC1v1023662C1 n=1 Tax=Oldenlandia corymbosa var. corymbosa TaxID=529605 RepID=A0AAV1C167_OLDCO|nr:OLC1v1023662C1 [Oldenlandia corymbosa var. corymbosa]
MNGALHWVCCLQGYKCGVLLFDLSNNEFEVMMLPNRIRADMADSIDVYKGLLAIFLFDSYGVGIPFEFSVWVMETYPDEESWTNIDLSNDIYLSPLFDVFPTFSLSLAGMGTNSIVLLLDDNQLLEVKESEGGKFESSLCLPSMKWSSVKLVTIAQSLMLLDWGL